MKNELDLLTLEEVAIFLHINVKTVRKYINEGRMECVKLSERKTYVRRDQLNKFLRSCIFEINNLDSRAKIEKLSQRFLRRRNDR